jgi:hypothetical protein
MSFKTLMTHIYLSMKAIRDIGKKNIVDFALLTDATPKPLVSVEAPIN